MAERDSRLSSAKNLVLAGFVSLAASTLDGCCAPSPTQCPPTQVRAYCPPEPCHYAPTRHIYIREVPRHTHTEIIIRRRYD